MIRGQLAILAVVALACAMLITAVVNADVPTLADRVASLVPRYGSKKVALVDANEFGTAIDTACKHERDCAARLTAMAIAESALSLDVSRGVYTEHQGDSYRDKDGSLKHRAWSLFQMHQSAHNAAVFGSPDLLVQAKAARSMQLGALAECKAFRGLRPELGMWRILSGRGCLAEYSGEQKRMGLLEKIRRAL